MSPFHAAVEASTDQISPELLLAIAYVESRYEPLALSRIEGTKRPCRLAPAAVNEIDQWLGMLRKALSANYDRLDGVLAAMKTSE